jgi:uncharacterized protein
MPSHPPDFHIFETATGPHLLLVNGSRIFTITPELATALTVSADPTALLTEWGLEMPLTITDEPLREAPVRALSLAIAQKCNLGCTYCYAQEGGFGTVEKNMSPTAAHQAVELLFSEASAGDTVQLTFLGGEPLTNRTLLQACTRQAWQLALSKQVRVKFAVTTNGTLLTPADGQFFERYGFAVTISLDGVGEIHDQQRAFKGGQGSYQRIIANVRPLLDQQRQMQVSARVTVTPANLYLRQTLDEFIALGFHSVGFSPMLAAPTQNGEMHAPALEQMLAQMISCGTEFERRLQRRERYPFTNIVNALQELHKGTHRPYPCGAGAGYLGVSAEGDLYACHRFVEDPAGAMGNVFDGVARQTQQQWLATRHVHRQEPCRSCWARYLCGGGCHHEVLQRGRPACDYIRGWLHYCLQAYIRLLAECPEYFSA